MTTPSPEQLRVLVERACRHLSWQEGELLRAGLLGDYPQEAASARESARWEPNESQSVEPRERPAGGRTGVREALARVKVEADRRP